MLPYPLFDTLEHLQNTPTSVFDYLKSISIPEATQEYQFCLEFLKSYSHSPDTFTAYRREVERVLQWAWLICKKSLKEINRNDIREYLEFINTPPKTWISNKTTHRFILNSLGLREANPAWRPFVVRISKIARRHGKQPDKSAYQLSNKSLEAVFATLSSLYTFLQQEDYLELILYSLTSTLVNMKLRYL